MLWSEETEARQGRRLCENKALERSACQTHTCTLEEGSNLDPRNESAVSTLSSAQHTHFRDLNKAIHGASAVIKVHLAKDNSAGYSGSHS